MSVLRYDTPRRDRKYLAWLRMARVAPGEASVALACCGAMVALGGLTLAISAADVAGTVASLLMLAAVTGAALWLRARTRGLERWLTPVRVGRFEVNEAHRYYDALSADGKARAQPLLETLYRLAAVQCPATSDGWREHVQRMEMRWRAVEGLARAEERMRTSAAEAGGGADVEATRIWHAALAEVERASAVG